MNWNTGQEVTVSAAEDSDGLNGQATIRHTASGGDYASVTGDVTATESDNDRAISVTKTSVTVTEGSTATYSVSLATQPTGSVTVAVSRSSGDSDLTVLPASLTFTTMNWSQGQEVTVSAAEDNDLPTGPPPSAIPPPEGVTRASPEMSRRPRTTTIPPLFRSPRLR